MEVLDDLIFSVNTILPIFIIMILGYFILKSGIISENFIGMASNMVFYFALPAKFFLDVATSDLSQLMNIRFIVVSVGGTLFVFFAAWLVISRTVKDRSVVGAAVHSSFRGNYVYVGLPLIQNILRTDYVPCTVLVATFVAPLYNILGVIITSWYSGDMSQARPGKLILNIIKNPLIIAVILGVIWAGLRLPMPYAAERTFTYLGNMATPVALLMIGARIACGNMGTGGTALKLTVFFKMVFGPVIMTLLAFFLGMPAEEIVTIFVVFATPTAMNVYIMTKSMGGNDGFVARAILYTVACSVAVMTLGIFIMRTVGII